MNFNNKVDPYAFSEKQKRRLAKQDELGPHAEQILAFDEKPKAFGRYHPIKIGYNAVNLVRKTMFAPMALLKGSRNKGQVWEKVNL